MESRNNNANITNRASVPPSLKQLRACLLCRLIKSYDQFVREGCDNCSPAVSMQNDPDRVLELTTARYSGMVAVMQPTGKGTSWVAKWLRLDRAKAGLYAGKVEGEVPEEVQEELASRRGLE